MGLLLILPLLVSGYLVCLKHPGHYCRLHRFEGQLLYLQVARLGWTCLVLSFVLTTLILCLSKQPLQLAGQTIPIDYSAYLGKLLIELDIATERNHGLWVFLLQVGLTAMIIPYCWARLFVRWRRRRLQLASEEELNQQLMLELLTGAPSGPCSGNPLRAALNACSRSTIGMFMWALFHPSASRMSPKV